MLLSRLFLDFFLLRVCSHQSMIGELTVTRFYYRGSPEFDLVDSLSSRFSVSSENFSLLIKARMLEEG